jgi:RepB DNA-primase from phage plasmid
MQSDIKAAEKMIDLFTSVGATRFNVTFLDLLGRKTRYFPQRTPPSMRYNLSSWMAHAATRKLSDADDGTRIMAGENLVIRPVCTIPETAVTFVQLDDLKAEQLERVRPASFLIFSTSPGNHQAWIAVSEYKGDTVDLCRRVRQALGAGDHSATGSTRIAGSENFKSKYAPEFPVVSIVLGVPGRVMTQERLRDIGLLTEPDQVVPPAADMNVGRKSCPASERGRTWPDYARCLAGAPPNGSGTGPDRSLADYTFCKFAAQRGWSVEEIAAELPNVSEKARERIANRDPGYVTKTAENATAAALRGRPRSRV